MTARIVLASVAVALLAACNVVESDAKYQTATLVLPEGHPEPGRAVFVNLGCTSCHAVAWDADLPQPVAEKPGPVLDDTLWAVYAGVVATSIIAPSHTADAGYLEHPEALSPMGDYTEAMTVRQLVDVVAYLRQEGTTSARNVPPTGT